MSRIPTKKEIALLNKRFGVGSFSSRLKRDLKAGIVKFNKDGKIVVVKKKRRSKQCQ